ncbi:MAG: alpha-mannosidase [Planctomycetota bacterium]|nr:MAG: alpha-mannosidase [Planctomycetota bacterium]
MPKPIVHLVCNAHLDPVWQWEWEEGASEAISTFRTAADLCEEFGGFIFNHNEVILYKWVEAYEPTLFKRIQRLVKEGKWHIMGGWYLQPDCNMPSGEGFVRQILVGREYFKSKFNKRPTTAINFDPFGHTRGLVQILSKSGYDSYIHCRPNKYEDPQKEDNYIWIGYDGSEIICTRPPLFYNSPLGKAGEKLNKHISETPEIGVSMMLWGLGNHGGGPSRKDIRDVDKIIKKEKNWDIRHSTPEAHFEDLNKKKDKLIRWEKDMNPWAVGCYTTMILVKQGFRKLENEMFMVEKMASAAASQGLMKYPHDQFKEAEEDLLWTAFHDVLPGSSTEPVEQHTINKVGHGLEILGKIRAHAFFCLANGQAKAKLETFPIFVFNPHPWEIEILVTAEFNLPDIIMCKDTFWLPTLKQNGKNIPIQAERPHSNMPMDWRKRVCFKAKLKPGIMNRYDIQLTRIPIRPTFSLKVKNNEMRIKHKNIDWSINSKTGLISHLKVNGKNLLEKNAFKALIIADNPDPWGMTVDRFDKVLGHFRLLSKTKSAEFSGVSVKKLNAIRIIEDGPVRTVVEIVYGYKDSFLVLTWKLPKVGTEIELETRVYWNEKDKILKLAIPTKLKDPAYHGEVAYGQDTLSSTGQEAVAQKWSAAVSKKDDIAISMINNGTYGSSFEKGEMRISLLRSPAYTAHPIQDWPIVPNDSFRPRIDQGERVFKFWFNAGSAKDRLKALPREALVHNEVPMTQ